MGGVRNGNDAGSSEAVDSRQRSPAGVSVSGGGSEVPDVVERHRRTAARLLNEGQAARAFGELVRASRGMPMTPRLAAVLVAFSLRAGTEAAAIALLSSALGNTRGDTRRAVRLQLARLLRRVDQLPRAVETLQALVAESPGDRRARKLIEEIFRRINLREQTPTGRSEAMRDAEPPAQEPPRSEAVEGGTRIYGTVPAPPPPRGEVVEGGTRLYGRVVPVVPVVPWEEDEPTAEAVRPPDARFQPRAPSEPRKSPPRPSPWLEDEVTSEASDLPDVLAGAPAPTPRADSSEEVSDDRHETLEVAALGPQGTAESSAPAVRPEAPSTPPSGEARAEAPTAWSHEEDAGPSRPLVPRQESPEDTRIEAQLIARQAWRELAQFYLARADGAKDPSVRAESLTRLAEVLEDELQDPAGAARVYGQIVSLTGDQTALAEQVRLLSQRGDADDWAVQRASNPRARASAFLARGERLLSIGERALARADFEAAEGLAPGSLPALMGLVRCGADADRPRAVERLRVALAAAPRRTPFRLEGLRCLAESAGGSITDARLAHWAWSEVLAENPEDVLARDRLLELARQLGDKAGLSRLLRARIAREPRGLVARGFRLELVATLEALGDREAALAELRQAVRFEPGHKEAWLLLVDRLIALQQHGEAAWALEHAATATEDDTERLGTWERLARFCREVLGDAARTQVYANRAENLRRAIAEREAPALHPEPPRSAIPKQEQSGSRTVVLIPPPGEVELTPKPRPAAPASAPTVLELPAIGEFAPTWNQEAPAKEAAPASRPPSLAREPASASRSPALPREPASAGRSPALPREPASASRSPALPREPASAGRSPALPREPASASRRPPEPAPVVAPEPPSAPFQVEGTQVIAWEAPPGKMDPARRRVRGGPVAPTPAAPAAPAAPVAPAAKPAPAPTETRPAAFERVREQPLDASAYRELSAFFSARSDTARAALMAEVASALAGEKDAVPRPPRRTLTPEERAGLRHPGLRNPAGELLASVGLALCRLFPTFGRAAGSSEPFRPDSSPGARAAMDALLSVSRILDAPLPEIFLSEDEGPPFTLIHPGAPRLLVGRLALRQVLPESELRFFAGRALSGLGPDLLALRCLKKDQLLRAVAILASVLRGGTEFGPESRVVRDALHPKSHERARVLLESAQQDFDAAALAEAARHSANRAGLVACGGPGPAVAAMRALKSSEQELAELVRFAASERYLPLRG
jgi:tetratricopeptide (TPR) repeat protein